MVCVKNGTIKSTAKTHFFMLKRVAIRRTVLEQMSKKVRQFLFVFSDETTTRSLI